jgi:hypothetical protein
MITTGQSLLVGISTTQFSESTDITAAFKDKFRYDGNAIIGLWKWPEGGYEVA